MSKTHFYSFFHSVCVGWGGGGHTKGTRAILILGIFDVGAKKWRDSKAKDCLILCIVGERLPI